MTDTKTEFGAVVPLKPGTPATEQNTIEHKPGTPAATSTGFNSLWERFDEYAADMKATPKTVKTGFKSIDDDLKFNGFTMLGGASGAGKTSLCLNIALNRAKDGFKTVFYSLEMPVFTLVNRLICMDCGIDYIHAADYWQPFKDKAAEYMKNIYFVGITDIVTDNLPKFDTGENSDLVKTIEQARGEDQGAGDVLIIIDSLHLLPADAADVRAATNENVRKIRTLTDTYHVNTLVIGQSKRGEKSFEYLRDIYDRKTEKFDTAQLRAQFRESALIEYAADALFYILNANPDRSPTGIGTDIKWLCAVKNRIADTGINSDQKIKGFEFNGIFYRFVDKYGYSECLKQAAEDAAEDEAPNASSNGKQTGKQATRNNKRNTKNDTII